jgi:hypothetical protein
MREESNVQQAAGEQALIALDPAGLLGLLRAHEDRVPREWIEECARRGEAMVAALSDLIRDDAFWGDDVSLGQWWLRFHAAMILGLIASEAAGTLLVDLMRRLSQAEDDALQDWLAGLWPLLFRNKPDGALGPLRELAQDRKADWYIRTGATDACLAMARERGEEPTERALAWLAAIVADEQEDWDLRLCGGNALLDFPRAQYRPLLESLAERQTGFGAHFVADDVDEAYRVMRDGPNWERFNKDIWHFYTPQAIAARQERWAEEDERAAAWARRGDLYDDFYDAEPYVRANPKIGRNDPCPCGSGKKYKKCCLPKGE